jgi:hypothetical protein
MASSSSAPARATRTRIARGTAGGPSTAPGATVTPLPAHMQAVSFQRAPPSQIDGTQATARATSSQERAIGDASTARIRSPGWSGPLGSFTQPTSFVVPPRTKTIAAQATARTAYRPPAAGARRLWKKRSLTQPATLPPMTPATKRMPPHPAWRNGTSAASAPLATSAARLFPLNARAARKRPTAKPKSASTIPQRPHEPFTSGCDFGSAHTSFT